MPGGNGVMETPLQARVLDEAAEWLMRLHDSGATDADRAACERWRQADPQHALAWERAERLLGKLGGLPAALAMPGCVDQRWLNLRTAQSPRLWMACTKKIRMMTTASITSGKKRW